MHYLSVNIILHLFVVALTVNTFCFFLMGTTFSQCMRHQSTRNCIFLDIDSSILQYMVSEYFTARDIANFSVAASNHVLRCHLRSCDCWTSLVAESQHGLSPYRLFHEIRCNPTSHFCLNSNSEQLWIVKQNLLSPSLKFNYDLRKGLPDNTLFARLGKVEEVSLFVPELTNTFTLAISTVCPNLASLTISRIRDSVPIVELLDTCKDLKRLNLKFASRPINLCNNLNLPITLQELKLSGKMRIDAVQLFQCCPMLTELDLSNSTIQSLQGVAQCRYLTTLQLAHLTNALSDFELTQIVSQCKLLTKLDVSASHLTDCGLAAIGLNCGSLVSLNLYGCWRVSRRGLVSISSGCTLLADLTVQNTNVNSPCGDDDATLHFPRLQRLYMAHANCAYLLSMMTSHLLVLKLYCNDHFTGAEACVISQNCSALQQLEILSFAPYYVYPRISTEILRIIFHNSNVLRAVNLCTCLGVTEEGMRHIATHATHLQKLALCCYPGPDWNQYAEEWYIHLLQCPNLRHLYFTPSPEVFIQRFLKSSKKSRLKIYLMSTSAVAEVFEKLPPRLQASIENHYHSHNDNDNGESVVTDEDLSAATWM